MRLLIAGVALIAACGGPSQKQRAAGTPPSKGSFEDCYYDCKPGQKQAPQDTATVIAPDAKGAPAAPAARTVASEKSQLLRDAADLLDKAAQALADGNKNRAEQLFSSAELIVGVDALADLAPKFREGAPPRITTPLKPVNTHVAAQPRTVGSSEEEDAEEKVKPPRVEGQLSGTVQIDGKPLTGAFGLVTLEPASGKWKPRTPKQRTIEQRMREFLPHVLAIPVGSTVSFPNADAFFHNVFSTSPLAPFDLGIYKAGEAREYTFTKEGIIRIGCNLHANMAAYIAVVSAPSYVITDDSGHFEFKHLAPGKYKLKAWSERSKAPITQDITIKAGPNTVAVGVAADAPAGPSPDKFGGKRG